MQKLRTTIVMAALALASATCNVTGPSGSLAGTWQANIGGKFGFVSIDLQQSGDQISGTACRSDANLVMFRNVPVRGDYPDVRFDVAASYLEPCCLVLTGDRFAGRRDSTGDIVGVYNDTEVRFKKTTNPLCR